ncbi:MAG TPA: FAD-dependent oxidoreductase [Solirubrobacteraceae bacterium]|jgi:sulfide:quinone oxidoreductase
MEQPRRHVIVAGGGPAAVETILALQALSGQRLEVELLAPNAELALAPYEVMAPFREGHERRYPLTRIASDAGAGLVADSISGVDPERHVVITRSGAERSYDTLVVAVGARRVDTVAGAHPFRGARDAGRLKTLLAESDSGRHVRVAFVVPAGVTWPLPLYELALHTAAWLAERGIGPVPLTFVSPESDPLAVFGRSVSEEVASLLEQHGVTFLRAHPVRLHERRLLLMGGDELEVDVAFAVPRLEGPRIAGLPCDEDGFLPIDEFGRVRGAADVFAAGDAADFPVKQGGLAAQQADVIAQRISADAGADVESSPFSPVLRARLFAGREQRYLHRELEDEREHASIASADALWSPPYKLAGQYIAPYLTRLDEERAGDPGPSGDAPVSSGQGA